LNKGGEIAQFAYFNRGMLAYIGGHKALYALSRDTHVQYGGFMSWLMWNAAYITQLVSWRNKIMIPMYWFKSAVFGRDVAQF
jgi:NADH dehydrogenase